MTTRNLWGDLPTGSDVVPPSTILREQAAILSDQTNNILAGEVRVVRDDDVIRHALEIVAPALDNYRYTVLVAQHRVDLYPVSVLAPQLGRGWVECGNEAAFVAEVERILKSEPLRRVVGALLAQSKTGWA